METNALRFPGLMFALVIPATGFPQPELIDAHGESYVNLQLCSNTYLEYRDRPQVAKQFLDASLRIQAAYTTDEQLDTFIDAIQRAHDRQGSIEVYEGESRREFYRRVFSEERCEQELDTAKAFQWPSINQGSEPSSSH